MQRWTKLSVLLVVGGLVVSGLGAWWTSQAVIIDEKTADALSGTVWNQNQALKQALLEQSRAAEDGLYVIAIGSLLQVAGVLLQAARR